MRLLQIELQKLWNNRASKLLVLAYFGLLTTIALIAAIKFDIGPIQFHLAEQGIFNFPYIWHFNTYIAGLFKLFLAIVIVSMMANEYSYKTLKQNLIDGLSKKEFVLSKIYTTLFFAGLSTVFIFILSLILGYSFSSYTGISSVFKDIEYLLAFFLKLTAFFSFCLFLGVLVKRSAFALGFLLLWAGIEKLIYLFLGTQLFSWETAKNIHNFFPLEAISNSITEPFTRLSAVKSIAQNMGEEINKHQGISWSSICIITLWSIIFSYATYFLIKKRDL